MIFMSKISLVLETLSTAQLDFSTYLAAIKNTTQQLPCSTLASATSKPAKYAPAILQSRPYEKDCPKVFDLRKPKYSSRTGQPISR
ncbi:hypothetical protein WJX77_000941 [Trebouxia sp. C0004]